MGGGIDPIKRMNRKPSLVTFRLPRPGILPRQSLFTVMHAKSSQSRSRAASCADMENVVAGVTGSSAETDTNALVGVFAGVPNAR